jgi:Zn-dependent protease with chaperone function
MSYTLRLADVCLASYFLLNLALEIVALALSRVARRGVERMRPANGARLLLLLRLLPSTLSLLGALALCLPSYLRFEQDASESIGTGCTLLALCGFAMAGASAARLLWGLRASAAIEQDGCSGPVFALVGFLRPRVMISQPVRNALSDAQMDAALRHERAHRSAGDNLKRLALLAAPRPLGLRLCFRGLEREWMRLAEWAADDAAIAGEPARALALAEALVSVARLCGNGAAALVASSLVACNEDLERRVQRLLNTRPATSGRSSGAQPAMLTAAASTAAAILLALAARQSEVLALVHSAMESLAH